MTPYKIRNNKKHLLHNRDWLYEQYVINDLSGVKIEQLFGDCTATTVRSYLIEHDISKPIKCWTTGLTKETDARLADIAKKNKISHLGQVAWNKELTKQHSGSQMSLNRLLFLDFFLQSF